MGCEQIGISRNVSENGRQDPKNFVLVIRLYLILTL